MKYISFLFILFFVFANNGAVHAQNILPVSGGSVSGPGGSVSYTIGQPVYSSGTEETKSVSQGFQQAYDVSEITGIKTTTGIILECSVYPNPVSDYIRLKIVNNDNLKLSYKLYDNSGIILQNVKMESDEVLIPMQKHVPGTYFLKVTDAQQEYKIFKIIKN